MAWQPNPESLKTLTACLKDSLSGFDSNAQKQAEILLHQAKSSPDINNYLAYILSNATSPAELAFSAASWHLIRSSAAIMLKNNIKAELKKIPESSLGLVKLAVPIGLQDSNPQIRSYAGNVATELIKAGGLFSWPELLPELLKMLSNETGQVSSEAQEGAMATMAKICEDNTKMLEREHNGQRPLNFILPKCIQATKSPLWRVRVQALTAINVFTPRKSQAMFNCIDDLLQHLFYLAEDTQNEVRIQVCRAFVRLVDTRPDKLLPHMGGLVDYITSQQKSSDEVLACEAAEFWLTIGEHDNLWQALQPYIQTVIPVLLDSMVYSPEDIALLGGASDDEDEEDRDEDIKPGFAKKNLARSAAAAAAAGDAGAFMDAQGGGGGNAYEKLASLDDNFEEGEIEDLDQVGDEPDGMWTLRKCSAAALDVLARDFGPQVFTSIMPYLQTNLKHSEWPYREAAVLALGAIADGCIDVVVPHMPELVPYLITLLEDPEPVVRQITCWTLGRYSSWGAKLKDPTQISQYFMPMMDGILRKMLDKNKKVQEAGASAMANLEEKLGKHLEPYCGPIIQQFVVCFSKYKNRNMWILYDCVQTLAEHVGPVLLRPENSNVLMPALIDRWQRVGDDSRELFPLLECLSYVAMALGKGFAPFADPIFSRCVSIIHQNLHKSIASTNLADTDQPDKDFLVTSIDLLSSTIQALDDERAAQLVAGHPTFFELLGCCLEHKADEVQQSAYALVGDCAKYTFEQLRPHLPQVLPMLVKRLDLDLVPDEEVDGCFNIVNNACWSAGEIAVNYKGGLAPFVPELLRRSVDIITNPRVPRGVSENAAILLGRLGLDNHDLVAPHLASYAEDFLTAMEDVEPTEEKSSAFKGFSQVVAKNPQAMEKVLQSFFVAIATYPLQLQTPIRTQLQQVFQNVLNIYREIMPQFNDFIAQMDAKDQASLRANYTI